MYETEIRQARPSERVKELTKTKASNQKTQKTKTRTHIHTHTHTHARAKTHTCSLYPVEELAASLWPAVWSSLLLLSSMLLLCAFVCVCICVRVSLGRLLSCSFVFEGWFTLFLHMDRWQMDWLAGRVWWLIMKRLCEPVSKVERALLFWGFSCFFFKYARAWIDRHKHNDNAAPPPRKTMDLFSRARTPIARNRANNTNLNRSD